MKFVHAADLHIDSPLRGLARYEGAPVERIRHATREALANLVDLCLAEDAAFLLVAGDLYDQGWDDFNTALYVARQFQRLEREGVPVYLIFGNHDASEEINRRTPWPANVHVFADDAPHTFESTFGRQKVALHGMSFARREEIRNLVPDYPQPSDGALNIGLLHTNATGDTGHTTYAPCSVEQLAAKGYDYWALGHVHGYAVLHEHPFVVYSGNTQGRHARETGVKGCAVVSVEDGRVRNLEFRSTDVLRWHRETIELDESADLNRLVELAEERLESIHEACDGRLAAVRLVFTGRCPAHGQLTTDQAQQEAIADLRLRAGNFGDSLWLEKIQFRTRPQHDVEALRRGGDLVGELLSEIEAIASDPARLDELSKIEDLEKLFTKVRKELTGDELPLDDPERLRGWLRAAEGVLLEELADCGA